MQPKSLIEQSPGIPIIEATVEPVPEAPPPRQIDIYLVAAYWRGRGWGIYRKTNDHDHASREAAEKDADQLLGNYIHEYSDQ